MHTYERWMILQYFCALLKLKPFEKAPDQMSDIIGWIKSHGRSLGLPPLSWVEESSENGRRSEIRAMQGRRLARMAHGGLRRGSATCAGALAVCRSVLIWLVRKLRPDGIPSAICSGLSHGSPTTACALIWSRPETKSLEYAAVDRAFDLGQLRRFLPQLTHSREIRDGGLAAKFGLLRVDHGGDFRLTDVVEADFCRRDGFARKEVRGLLLGDSQPASLAWEDFDHIGEARELAARIVAAGDGIGGANILLYGPPGTGKSEFAKTLGAQRWGAACISSARRTSMEQSPSVTSASPH